MSPLSHMALVTRSLTPYTRRFYDELATQRSGRTTSLLIGRRETDWINPWDAGLLTPRIAEHFYVGADVKGRTNRLVLPTSKLFKALTTRQPDVVAVQEYSPLCVGAALWAMGNGIPYFLLTEIGGAYGPPYPPLNLLQKVIHRLMMRGARGVIALTPDALTRAQRRQKPCVLAPHAIDVSNYIPSGESRKEPSPVVIITTGNFIHRKGYDLLLLALAEHHKNSGNLVKWHLKCYGDGEAKGLMELASKLGISPFVTFHSFIGESELIKAYQTADIFAFASRKETYGVVVHEAAACGLPLIVSKHVGASEVLAHENENAFLIEPNNVQQFATALKVLISNPNLRVVYGRNSRRIAEEWDVKRNAAKTAQWLDDVGRL